MTETDMSEYGLIGQYEAMVNSYKDEYIAGRILSQEKGIYRIITKYGEQFAEVSGKFRYGAKSISDFPAVGDFILADSVNISGKTIIHSVLPRKSAFIRRAAGTSATEQVVAANIDTVFICMSLNNDFNIRRLERYLSVTFDSGAIPVVVLTKSDLCSDPETYISQIEKIAIGTDIVLTSGFSENGCSELLQYIGKGKTVALTGSSGVGKSTIINRLLGKDCIKTNGLRNDGKGRHTTTRRELFLLPGGGTVIDTPGMRELGMWNTEDGLDKTFSDIEELSRMCRFNDCTHTGEPGCAVRAAIVSGVLSPDRLESYRKLKAENRYSENATEYMAEKKEKFKNIAKINRSNEKR